MYSSIVIKGARGNFFFLVVYQGDKKSEKESRKNVFFNSLLRRPDFIEKHKK